MNYPIKIITFTAILVAIISAGSLVKAGDLDDGISKYKGESIEKADALGKPDLNISFIVLDAMATAKRKKDDKNVNINDGTGPNNKNSVVCEVGADCSGDIININLMQ